MAGAPNQINQLAILQFVNTILDQEGFAPLPHLDLLLLKHVAEPDELWTLLLLEEQLALFVRYRFVVADTALLSEGLSADLLTSAGIQDTWLYLGQVWEASLFNPCLVELQPRLS